MSLEKARSTVTMASIPKKVLALRARAPYTQPSKVLLHGIKMSKDKRRQKLFIKAPRRKNRRTPRIKGMANVIPSAATKTENTDILAALAAKAGISREVWTKLPNPYGYRYVVSSYGRVRMIATMEGKKYTSSKRTKPFFRNGHKMYRLTARMDVASGSEGLSFRTDPTKAKVFSAAYLAKWAQSSKDVPVARNNQPVYLIHINGNAGDCTAWNIRFTQDRKEAERLAPTSWCYGPPRGSEAREVLKADTSLDDRQTRREMALSREPDGYYLGDAPGSHISRMEIRARNRFLFQFNSGIPTHKQALFVRWAVLRNRQTLEDVAAIIGLTIDSIEDILLRRVCWDMIDGEKPSFVSYTGMPPVRLSKPRHKYPCLSDITEYIDTCTAANRDQKFSFLRLHKIQKYVPERGKVFLPEIMHMLSRKPTFPVVSCRSPHSNLRDIEDSVGSTRSEILKDDDFGDMRSVYENRAAELRSKNRKRWVELAGPGTLSDVLFYGYGRDRKKRCDGTEGNQEYSKLAYLEQNNLVGIQNPLHGIVASTVNSQVLKNFKVGNLYVFEDSLTEVV